MVWGTKGRGENMSSTTFFVQARTAPSGAGVQCNFLDMKIRIAMPPTSDTRQRMERRNGVRRLEERWRWGGLSQVTQVARETAPRAAGLGGMGLIARAHAQAETEAGRSAPVAMGDTTEGLVK